MKKQLQRATGRDLQERLSQLELPLEGATQFFYFYGSIIEDGHLARMGPEAIAVLSVMRYRCNWDSSTVSIGSRQLAELTGMSPKRVSSAIKKLELEGYIETIFHEERKRSIYKLKDKISFKDRHGVEVMNIDLDYRPTMLREQLSKLKSLKEGHTVVPTQREGMTAFFVIDNSINNQQVVQINLGNDAIEALANAGAFVSRPTLESKETVAALARMALESLKRQNEEG